MSFRKIFFNTIGSVLLLAGGYSGFVMYKEQMAHHYYFKYVIPQANDLLERAAISDRADYNFFKAAHLKACEEVALVYGADATFTPVECVKLMHLSRPNARSLRNYSGD